MAKNITLSAFIDHSHIDATLIRSVVRQFGTWEYFKQSAQDIAQHGAAGGWSGFTYFNDTVPFTGRNKKAIMAHAETTAQDIGESGALEFISGFQCLKGYTQAEVAEGLYNPLSDAKTDVFNALAWFALEEVARSLADMYDQR